MCVAHFVALNVEDFGIGEWPFGFFGVKMSFNVNELDPDRSELTNGCPVFLVYWLVIANHVSGIWYGWGV